MSQTICVICGVVFPGRVEFGLCGQCCSRERLAEYNRLCSALTHAQRAGREADLTLIQWLSILSDWGGKCAWCDEALGYVIEEFERNGGVTYSNVVPACRSCHAMRHGGIYRAEARIRKYLQLGQIDDE